MKCRDCKSAQEQIKEFERDWEAKNGQMKGRWNGQPVKEPTPKGSAGIVLQAAKALQKPFSLTDLVIAAWKLSPQHFGLKGMEAYIPSDRRVYMTLCGPRGLVARGLIRHLPGGRMEVVYAHG